MIGNKIMRLVNYSRLNNVFFVVDDNFTERFGES